MAFHLSLGFHLLVVPSGQKVWELSILIVQVFEPIHGTATCRDQIQAVGCSMSGHCRLGRGGGDGVRLACHQFNLKEEDNEGKVQGE